MSQSIRAAATFVTFFSLGASVTNPAWLLITVLAGAIATLL